MAEPHPIDIYAGKNLRQLRHDKKMSQEELGQKVGVTFQQIQKYERGLNRMGCGRLFEFAVIFKVSALAFFPEAENEGFLWCAIKHIFSELEPDDQKVVLDVANALVEKIRVKKYANKPC